MHGKGFVLAKNVYTWAMVYLCTVSEVALLLLIAIFAGGLHKSSLGKLSSLADHFLGDYYAVCSFK